MAIDIENPGPYETQLSNALTALVQFPSLGGFLPIGVQEFTVAGEQMYTPTPGTKGFIVLAFGASGGSGGVSGAGNAFGGRTWTGEGRLAVGVLASEDPIEITIGAAGAGGNSSTSFNGTDGGDTIFPGVVTATGSGGGPATTTTGTGSSGMAPAEGSGGVILHREAGLLPTIAPGVSSGITLIRRRVLFSRAGGGLVVDSTSNLTTQAAGSAPTAGMIGAVAIPPYRVSSGNSNGAAGGSGYMLILEFGDPNG